MVKIRKNTASVTYMFQRSKKVKLLKFELKKWHSSKFSHLNQRFANNAQKLKSSETQLFALPNDSRLLCITKRLIKQREKLLLFSQNYGVDIRIRIGLRMEIATKFFHSLNIVFVRIEPIFFVFRTLLVYG